MDLSDRYAAWKYAGGHGGFLGAAILFFALPGGIAARGWTPPVPFLMLFPIGAILGYAIGKFVSWALLEGSSQAAQSFTMPNTAGFYAHEHSEIQTLEIRGDVKGAVSAWEAVSIAEPGNPWPLVRSAELYADKLGDPAMALERFRLARSCPDIKPELKRYTSQKVIDLLLGPMNDKGRAMVELRILIDTFPESREAAGARDALRRLKSSES